MLGSAFQSKRQTWVRSVSQRNSSGSRPIVVGSTLRPPRGCNIQRHTVPVTTNESDMGKRKRVRKKPSPATSWSRRKASHRPTPRQPARKKMVKKKVLTRSWRKRTSMKPVNRSR
jgi:hypothetical protein